MSKIIAIAAICSLLLAVQAASLQKYNVTSMFVGNLTEYLRTHAHSQTIIPLRRVEDRVRITYELGRRISGDRVVATSSQSNSWASPQDVTFTLAYPKSGVGAVVTFLQIVVNQSSNLGRGVVLSGGIGQRQITVAIEARSTTYFQQNSQIYGY